MTIQTVHTIFVGRNGSSSSYDALGFDLNIDGVIVRHAVQYGDNIPKDGLVRREWIRRGVETLQAWLDDKCLNQGLPHIKLLPPAEISP